MSFIALGENALARMILMSLEVSPVTRAFMTRTCSLAEPWHDSQPMPGSAQVVW